VWGGGMVRVARGLCTAAGAHRMGAPASTRAARLCPAWRRLRSGQLSTPPRPHPSPPAPAPDPQARKLLRELPSLVDVDVPDSGHITVCGDVHGQVGPGRGRGRRQRDWRAF
jgi:hypothetical protein